MNSLHILKTLSAKYDIACNTLIRITLTSSLVKKYLWNKSQGLPAAGKIFRCSKKRGGEMRQKISFLTPYVPSLLLPITRRGKVFLNIFKNIDCMSMIRCVLESPDVGQCLKYLERYDMISPIETFLEPLEGKRFLKN